MKWIDALKKYNEHTGMWCVPRRGSFEYQAVMKIMNENSEAPKKKSKVSKHPMVEKPIKESMMREITSLKNEAIKMANEGVSATQLVDFYNKKINPKIVVYGAEYLPSGGASELGDEIFDEITGHYLTHNISKKKVKLVRRAKTEEPVKEEEPKKEEPKANSTTLFPLVSRSQYKKNIEMLRLAFKNLTSAKETKPKVVDRPLYNEIKNAFFNSERIINKNLTLAFMNGLVYIYNKKYSKKELQWLDWFDASKTGQAYGNHYTQSDNYEHNALGKYFNIYSNDKGDDNKNVWRSENPGYFFGFAD